MIAGLVHRGLLLISFYVQNWLGLQLHGNYDRLIFVLSGLSRLKRRYCYPSLCQVLGRMRRTGGKFILHLMSMVGILLPWTCGGLILDLKNMKFLSNFNSLKFLW